MEQSTRKLPTARTPPQPTPRKPQPPKPPPLPSSQHLDLIQEKKDLLQQISDLEAKVLNLFFHDHFFLSHLFQLNEAEEKLIEEQPSLSPIQPFLSMISVSPEFWCGFLPEVSEVLIQQWTPLHKVPFPLSTSPSTFFLGFLGWLRRGWTFEIASSFLKLPDSTLRRHFHQCISDLSQWARDKVYFPPLSEWKERNERTCRPPLSEVFPNHLFLWVDGTVLETWNNSEVLFLFLFDFNLV
jgi:hypothetical protein